MWPDSCDIAGFHQFTLTLDLRSLGNSNYSSDEILRDIQSRIGSTGCSGLVVFDIGRGDNPHVHGIAAVPSAECYESLMAVFEHAIEKWGKVVDHGKLLTSDDIGRWITYIWESKPWHGNLPRNMLKKFGRFRGMAFSFGMNLLEKRKEVGIKITGGVDIASVSIPTKVSDNKGHVVTIPSTKDFPEVCSGTKQDLVKHIESYASGNVGAMIASALSLLERDPVRLCLAVERVSDPMMVERFILAEAKSKTFAANMIYNQVFEIRASRVFLATKKLMDEGCTVDLTVDGKVVPPGLDRCLFDVYFRPLKGGKSLV